MNFRWHLRSRWALAPVVGVHAAVLAMLIGESAGESRRASVPRAMVLVDVAPPAPPRPSHPTPRSPVRVPVVPATLLAPASVEIAPDAAAMPALSEASLAPGETCDLADKVQTALREDPTVRAALAMLPRDARSVANAVMLWDGHWIAGTTTSTRYALGRIKGVVVATVSSAPAPCRLEAQTGPALMILAGSPDAVLALGSGRWRWTDVFGARADVGETVTTARADAAPEPAT